MAVKSKVLVFDLDGTLVDSIRDIVPALNRTIALDGLPPIIQSEFVYAISQGARRMIELAFHSNKRPLSKFRQQELFSIFLENYEAHIADETIFFDGVLGALDELADENWRFAICTNKHERVARKLLKELGEINRFPVVTGGDSFSFKKPDPAHILETIKLAGGVPSRSIMVGDSVNDITAAKAANIPAIAVDFGYTDIPVSEMNPDVIISHFNDLPKIANTLLSQWN